MWQRLTYNDMRMYLAKDELDRLQNSNIDVDFTTVINDTLDMVADTFRGAWSAKGYELDVRDHYIDIAYKPFILSFARWVLWNRFPAAGDYALTETRKDEFKLAQDLLKNPYIATSMPDYSDDPQLSGLHTSSTDGAIKIPWMRFPAEPFETGFWDVYRYWQL